MRQAAILAGGKGSRLGTTSDRLPKPMVKIGGKPILEHQIELLTRYGFRDIVVFTGFGSTVIQEYFACGERWGVQIRYRTDEDLKGTAGAMLSGRELLADRTLVLYGDVMLSVDLNRFWETHTRVRSDATLFVHPNDHPHDSDLVEIDEHGFVIRLVHGSSQNEGRPNLVNAGLFIIERQALDIRIEWRGRLDFAKEFFPEMLRVGKTLYAYHSAEYVKDMGTPDRYAKVTQDFECGLIRTGDGNLGRPAVFLDRDGTITQDYDNQLVNASQPIELTEGAAQAIGLLNQSPYLAIVITNQPVVARGDCSQGELGRIHDKIAMLLKEQGAYWDAIYYCPHHPDAGYSGEIRELKIPCRCRKPSPGLIDTAKKEWNVELRDSWLIGDSTVDIRTAKNAGVRAVLVRTGKCGRDGKFHDRPDYEFYGLTDAVRFITTDYQIQRGMAQGLIPKLTAGAVVAIGGLARSGKSTFAAVLREGLLAWNQDVQVIPLDGWLKPVADRGPLVYDRYDSVQIQQLLSAIRSRKEVIRLRLPVYDRYTKSVSWTGEEIVIGSQTIVIFDGVVALTPLLEDVATHRIYIQCDEPKRRERFEKEYRLRGMHELGIRRLYEEREDNEHRLIRNAGRDADTVIAL